MNLRKNRRIERMSGDITSHIAQDSKLRQSFLEQGLAGSTPEHPIPTILKEQIDRELKDPRMQAEFKSGPEGRERVLQHFRAMSGQIDRLASLKDLERRVIEKEKRIARGEEVQEGEFDDEDEDDDFEPSMALSQNAKHRFDKSSLDPSDIVEAEYRRYLDKRDSFQTSETEHLSSMQEHTEALKSLPKLEHLPAGLQSNKDALDDIESSLRAHGAKFKKGSISGATPNGSAPLTPKQVVEPEPTSHGFDDDFVDAQGRRGEIAEEDFLPPWPTEEEITADNKLAELEDTKDDFLSPMSSYLKAERLRREEEHAQYLETVSGRSNVPLLPLVYREFIKTQLLLKLPVPDRFIVPFLPGGVTKEEFLVTEGLLPEGESPLTITTEDAIAQGSQEDTSIDTEAKLDIEGSCCHSLRDAVEKRHLGCLSVLCDPANGVISTGETPLHIAAILDNLTCARELIEKKVAKPTTLSTGRSSALHMACMRSNNDMIKYLIQAGSKVNQADDDGLTPLHLAVASGSSTSIVNYLIDKGANILSCDNQGANALHIAADSGNISMIRLLLAKGTPINEVTGDRESALFLACEQAHLEAVKLLLANGANANESNVTGFHPVHAAAKIGSYSVLEALLDSKAPATNGGTGAAKAYVKDAGDNTPLHIVSLFSNSEISEEISVKMAKKLIASGCPIGEINSEGWTALHIACQQGAKELIKLYLDVGASVHGRNDEGGGVLHIAMSAQKFEIVPLLVERGADVNVGDANNVTPLLLAIQEGREDVARLLMDRGARATSLTTDNISPLHMALEEGMFDLAELLLQKGASPTQQTAEGYQPIHIVAARGDIVWVKKFIAMGANPNAMTQVGLTPLRIAEENDYKELQTVLRSAGAREMDIFAWIELQEEEKRKSESADKQ